MAIQCVLTASFAHAGAALPAGKSKITLPLNGKPIDVFTYRPANFTNGPLLVVMHGKGRNADGYRDYAMPIADTFGMLVATPFFDTNRFSTDVYQRGNVVKKSKVQPKEEWTYSYIPKLVAEIRRREGRPDMLYYLIGHSAGGQFNTRLAAFLPGEAVRIVAANPGSHLFPTRDLPFPYGFGELPAELGGDDAIKRYLAAPLTLFLGTADTLPKDLDVTPTAMKQGATRIERGRNCFKLAESVAKKNGWPFGWRAVEAEGIGHSGAKMLGHPNAGVALLGDKCLTEPPGKAALMKKGSASAAAPNSR
jgi:poly(3-hydroxybutyrate) depolymerase